MVLIELSADLLSMFKVDKNVDFLDFLVIVSRSIPRKVFVKTSKTPMPRSPTTNGWRKIPTLEKVGWSFGAV